MGPLITTMGYAILRMLYLDFRKTHKHELLLKVTILLILFTSSKVLFNFHQHQSYQNHKLDISKRRAPLTTINNIKCKLAWFKVSKNEVCWVWRCRSIKKKKIIKFRIFRPMLPSMSKEKLYKIMYISRENIWITCSPHGSIFPWFTWKKF